MTKPAGKRRTGRELAVQLLFALDHNKTPLDETLPGFLAFKKENDEPLVAEEKPRKFCEELTRGVVAHWADIDERIKNATANFHISRIGGVERAILRLAVYEMVYAMDVPPVVAINEALEISKRFSGDEAASFINGVLDKIRKSLTRPARTVATPAEAAEQARDIRQTQAAAELAADPIEFTPGRDHPPA